MFLSLETDTKLYLGSTEELPKESPIKENRHNENSLKTVWKIQVIES